MRTFNRWFRVRHGVSLLAATGVAGLSLGPASTQRSAIAPVEDLRQALKIPVREPEKNPEELKYRERILGQRVAALRSISDLRRALQLQAAWRDAEAEATVEM